MDKTPNLIKASAYCNAKSLESPTLIPNKKLLIFDLNGVLCRKAPKQEFKKTEDWIESKSYAIQLRPGAKEFLRYCSRYYDLAIWSSTTYPNSQPIVDAFFTKTEQKHLAFIWYRDRTKFDPDYATNPDIKPFDTVKILDDIYSHPFFDRKWNKSNTYIIDDSTQKMRFNPSENVFIVPSFLGEEEEKVFDDLKLTMEMGNVKL